MPRRQELFIRWAQRMRRNGLLRPGDRAGVAVSGGADSVLLLEFMRLLAKSLGFVVSVVHFNHHLRGAESDADENFVRDLAARLGVDFIHGEADVGRVAREHHRNLEATARELRYRFFFSLTRRGRLDKVATAHTANDQAETILLRLLRGTGTRGLSGIHPTLEGRIVRPFLNLTRAEIEAEIAHRDLPFRTDSSNRNLLLRRNKIRLDLLPQLARDFNPEVVRLLAGLADRARHDEEFLESQARERAQAWRIREEEEEKIPVRPLAEFPPALARRVVRQMILAVNGSLTGFTHRHIEAVLELVTGGQSGRHLVLPADVSARREFEWLVIARRPQILPQADYSYAVTPPAEVSLPALGATLHFKIVEGVAAGEAYNQKERASLDFGKLSGELILRNWRPGDRFKPFGSRKSLKVKELFRQHRIAAEKREGWPVLECGRQIIWVRGFPVAASVASSEGTDRALIITEEARKTERSRGEYR